MNKHIQELQCNKQEPTSAHLQLHLIQTNNKIKNALVRRVPGLGIAAAREILQ